MFRSHFLLYFVLCFDQKKRRHIAGGQYCYIGRQTKQAASLVRFLVDGEWYWTPYLLEPFPKFRGHRSHS